MRQKPVVTNSKKIRVIQWDQGATLPQMCVNVCIPLPLRNWTTATMLFLKVWVSLLITNYLIWEIFKNNLESHVPLHITSCIYCMYELQFSSNSLKWSWSQAKSYTFSKNSSIIVYNPISAWDLFGKDVNKGFNIGGTLILAFCQLKKQVN